MPLLTLTFLVGTLTGATFTVFVLRHFLGPMSVNPAASAGPASQSWRRLALYGFWGGNGADCFATHCSPAQVRLHSACIPPAFRLRSACVPPAFRLRSACVPPAFRLRSACVPPAFRLRSACVPPAFRLRSACVPPAFRLRSACVPPAQRLLKHRTRPRLSLHLCNLLCLRESFRSLMTSHHPPRLPALLHPCNPLVSPGAGQVPVEVPTSPSPAAGKSTRDRIEASFPAIPSAWLAQASLLRSSVSSGEARLRRAWTAGCWAWAVLRGEIPTPSHLLFRFLLDASLLPGPLTGLRHRSTGLGLLTSLQLRMSRTASQSVKVFPLG